MQLGDLCSGLVYCGFELCLACLQRVGLRRWLSTGIRQRVQITLSFGEALAQRVDLTLRGFERGAGLDVGFEILGIGSGKLLAEVLALAELRFECRDPLLVVARLGIEMLGARPPEVAFLFGQLVGSGLGDLELFLQLLQLGALVFEHFLELASFTLPARTFGFDTFESVREDVGTLLDSVLRCTLAFELGIELGELGLRVPKCIVQQRESLFG